MGKDKKGPSKMMIMLSVIALILAGVVSVFNVNLWLAGTQWILISIVFGVYAVFLGGCDCTEECCRKE